MRAYSSYTAILVTLLVAWFSKHLGHSITRICNQKNHSTIIYEIVDLSCKLHQHVFDSKPLFRNRWAGSIGFAIGPPTLFVNIHGNDSKAFLSRKSNIHCMVLGLVVHGNLALTPVRPVLLLHGANSRMFFFISSQGDTAGDPYRSDEIFCTKCSQSLCFIL